MDTAPPVDLHPAAAELARVVAGVTEVDLDKPTPCPAYRVAGMLTHIAGLALAFADCAAKVVGPTTGTPPSAAPDLPADWRTLIPQRLAALADAWVPPSAWEGDSTVGGVTSPAARNGLFANDELVVHGWDLARATGQSYDPAEANVRACFELATSIPDDPQVRDGGLFGPRVPVTDDASLLDRAVAATGRDPGWHPAAVQDPLHPGVDPVFPPGLHP